MKRYQKANEGIHAPEEVKENAARPAGKRPYTKWTGAVAAVLAVAIIGGAAMHSGVFGDPAADTPTQDPGVPAPFSMESESPVQGRATPEDGPKEDVPDTYTYGGGSHEALALSMAEYPEMAPYPKDEEFVGADGRMDYDAWGDAYDTWLKSRSALLPSTDFDGLMDKFLTASTAQFLTGAGEDNLIYSPLNVYMALSMLAETTGGNSRQQILDLLQADSIEALRTRAAELWRGNYRDDGVVTSILANSLWLRGDKDLISYNRDTLDTLARDYYASSFSGEMGSEEYNQALRDWLNEQTRGLLAEQAQNLEMDPATVLALASTIYFKAAWDSEFNKEATTPDIFHAPSGDVETDFMRKTMESAYYCGEHFAAVQLHFQQGRSMWLILPDEGYTVDQLLESGEAMDFLLRVEKRGYTDEETGEYVEPWSDYKYLNINLSMPKFDVSSDLDLIEGLKGLCVTDIFDTDVSNFRPLGGSDYPLYVGKAQHAARVKVDEEGCEAAAYTVIMVACGAAMPPDEEVDFTLDRPFLFAVTGSGLPLFTGVVNQPAG